MKKDKKDKTTQTKKEILNRRRFVGRAITGTALAFGLGLGADAKAKGKWSWGGPPPNPDDPPSWKSGVYIGTYSF